MVSLIALTAMSAQHILPFVSPLFQDHMVLQRGKRNVIWGWTTPGGHVQFTIDGRTTETVADPAGRWTIRFSPPPVGGPYDAVIDGPRRVELKDLLVGDVWLCSGQSNMEMGISQARNAEAEIVAATDSHIRMYMVGRQVSYSPSPIVASGQWRVNSPESVRQDGWGGFSAVATFFGRELRRELGVPIGLIQAAWGGTSAEAWVGGTSLRPLQDFDEDLAKIEALRAGPVYGTYLDLWMAENDPGTQEGWERENQDIADWQSVTVPNGFDGLGLSQKDGVAWFRREVVLSDSLPSGGGMISLGNLEDVDTVWINGVKVGGGSGQWNRQYGFEAGLLKPGRNVIAVRILDSSGTGGFTSQGDLLFLQLGDGSRVPLAGSWSGRRGAELGSGPRPKNTEPNPTVPTVLKYGMIDPIAPLAIRGAIWYQGETNGGRGYQYRKLLPALIADWRKSFGQGDFPFYIVSLANFQTRSETPGDDYWAELREAQAMTAHSVRNSGLAVTIDVGDANDVHPTDKQTVGHRLALIALAKEFGRRIEYSGPVYESMRRAGNEIILTFRHAKGLASKGERLEGFQIAGPDKKWFWANAQIQGQTVVVSAPEVPQPVAVRYAWHINPAASLVNEAGLPAVPFRTDDWPALSQSSR